MKNQQLIKFTTYGAFLSFFLFGFADTLKGPTLPFVLEELGFNYTQGGTLVLGSYFGFLVATFITGTLADLFGKKMVIFLACIFLIVGGGWYSISTVFWGLTFAMVLFGLGFGSLEVGGNLIIVDLHKKDKGRFLNLLGIFHGMGAMISPVYTGWLLDLGFSWRILFQIGGILVVGVLLYFLLIPYPQSAFEKKPTLHFKEVWNAILTPQMMLYNLLILLYVAAEIGMGSWLVEFLRESKGQSTWVSSSFLSLFFGAIVIGRFVGSFFVDRVGYLKSMTYVSFASIICLIVGIFAPTGFAFFLPCIGFFFSIIFPNVTAAVSNLHQKNLGVILGILFTFAGIGGMLGPWSVGIASDWVGIHWGFAVILVYCVAMTMILLALSHLNKKSSPSLVVSAPLNPLSGS